MKFLWKQDLQQLNQACHDRAWLGELWGTNDWHQSSLFSFLPESSALLVPKVETFSRKLSPKIVIEHIRNMIKFSGSKCDWPETFKREHESKMFRLERMSVGMGSSQFPVWIELSPSRSIMFWMWRQTPSRGPNLDRQKKENRKQCSVRLNFLVRNLNIVLAVRNGSHPKPVQTKYKYQSDFISHYCECALNAF